jgi:hypothetical protein
VPGEFQHSSSKNRDPWNGPKNIKLLYSQRWHQWFRLNLSNICTTFPQIKLYRQYLQENNAMRTRGPDSKCIFFYCFTGQTDFRWMRKYSYVQCLCTDLLLLLFVLWPVRFQTVYPWMVVLLMNDELKRIWKEAFVV